MTAMHAVEVTDGEGRATVLRRDMLKTVDDVHGLGCAQVVGR
jgi:hypothetical protein